MIWINPKKPGAHFSDPDQPLPLRVVNGRLDQLSLATIAQEIVLTLLDLRRLQITPSVLEAMLRDFDGIAKVAKVGFERHPRKPLLRCRGKSPTQRANQLRTPARRTERHVMNAEFIAKALGGRKAGSSWLARCPAHDDREPSLSITDAKGGRVLVHCHAGCDQRDVIAALRSRGAWETTGRRQNQTERKNDRRCSTESDPGDLKRTEAALAIWLAAQPADGTPVEAYLRSRGLKVFPPPAIRFHRRLKHHSGGVWPAMVALVTNGVDDTPIAIHRTFLARDGGGKAPVNPAKMMLGPCRGGAVCLGEPGGVLMVGEGIETCLAAMQATGHAAWAALSTSGLRALDLPRDARDVIVIADGDEPGEAAAQDCGRRWKKEGRRVRIARPPQGMDFNDLLKVRAPSNREGAL